MCKALLATVLTFSSLVPAASEGCGDKFLRVGRGARFQRGYVALHPAAIVLFARKGSAVDRTFDELEPALARAGHTTRRVADAASMAAALRDGQVRVLVTKPKIGAWGLNWQHCHRMSFFPSHSYEQYYQAVRRSWRFGQKHPVTVDIVTTEGGRHALENLQRKAEQADRMFDALVSHMGDAMHVQRTSDYTKKVEVPAWL